MKINSLGIKYTDILVNNVGVNYQSMPNAKVTEYNEMLNTNIKAPSFYHNYLTNI